MTHFEAAGIRGPVVLGFWEGINATLTQIPLGSWRSTDPKPLNPKLGWIWDECPQLVVQGSRECGSEFALSFYWEYIGDYVWIILGLYRLI